MGLPLAVTIELTQISCGKCGGTYAINEQYRQQKEVHKGFWNCPYCKVGWGYEKGLLEREEERHQATLARLNEAEFEKAKLERKLKRVSKGVCPECKRTFHDLARHMACKHAANP